MISNEATPTISIIIPVYQVAPYLRACLDSVLEQSFTDWEMLLVDDGSTDGSEKICDEYAEKDPRIRVFHQENRGLSGARNTGIDHAKGKYFAMIDPDDMLLSRDYLRLLHDAAVQNDAEISVCNMASIHENDWPELFDSDNEPVTVISGREAITNPIISIFSHSSACAKLYSRDRFADVRYLEGKLLEDLHTFHYLVYPCKRIAVLKSPMYGRRGRDGSIMTSTPAALLFQEVTSAYDDCLAYLKKNEDDDAIYLTERNRIATQFHMYLESLEDGSFSSIPKEILPEPEYFEQRFSYASIMHDFSIIDPDAMLPQIKSYRSHIAFDAMQLLLYSVNNVLQRPAPHSLPHERSRQLEIMSHYEDLLIFLHLALSRENESNPERQNRHFHSVLEATRKSVLSLNHQTLICREMKNIGLIMVPFLSKELLALYPEPWLRGEHAQFYWIKKTDLPALQKVMGKMSFIETDTDPLEIDQNSQWDFEHPDGTRITFISEMPFCFYGKYKTYTKSLGEALLSEQRGMTPAEYALILIMKLCSQHHDLACTRLRDILDLCLIMNTYPQLAADPSFQKKIEELSLENTFEQYRALCKAILDSTDLESYAQEDYDIVLNIVSEPFFRMSFLKNESILFLKEDTFLDPPKYAVAAEKNIAYLINSKAACSSLVASLMGDYAKKDRYIYEQKTPDDYSVHRTAEQRGIIHDKLESGSCFFTFTFVRNPFARLVSCYESKYHADLKIDNGYRVFDEYLRGYMAHDEGFTAFVKKVCSLPYRLMDRHFKRQYDLIYDSNGISRCDYIGHFETLRDDYDPIRIQYDLPDLPHLNRTDTENWMYYYTRETADLVYEKYNKDFIYFNYESSYRELLTYLSGN